jgi:hypothetical protein
VTRPHVEITLWALALAAGAMAGIGWRRAAPPSTSDASVVPAEPPAPRTFGAESLTTAARRVVVRDPFRLDRRPAAVAYRPELEGVPLPPPPPRAPRPALAVGGILGRPGSWAALLAGVPGREGSVLVRPGDVLGELVVRSVGPDTVVVRGADTTWRLGVRRTWQ